jgi:hypothetical protein
MGPKVPSREEPFDPGANGAFVAIIGARQTPRRKVLDPSTPLAEVSRALRVAASEVERQRREPNPRQPVHALDVHLDELERFNLAGGSPTSSPAVMGWLGRLQEAVGVPIPGWVLSVADTTQLHAAMLRWQGVLLTACRPERAEIPDLHEDPFDLVA